MREKLISALVESDDLRRNARADRLEWLSLHSASVSVIMGRAETLQLLEEARSTFIDGHFVAALLMAMAFIEHTVVDELQRLKYIKDSPAFGDAIRVAQLRKVFPPDWLVRAKNLSVRRNPFAHLKRSGHQHSLATRIMEESRHPHAIMEADAKDAIDLMYSFFIATLRDADLEKNTDYSDIEGVQNHVATR